jgi:hypothetical protein
MMGILDPHNHPLFRKYPIQGEVKTSCGDLPTPYHIYDGYGVFIGGSASLEGVCDLLLDERVTPVQVGTKSTPMGIWICNYSDGSLGPHLELQISFFVSNKPVKKQSTYPLHLLKSMLTDPDLQMLCHGLWNDSQVVVAYNREILSLNARLVNGDIRNEEENIIFRFEEEGRSTPLISGEVCCQASVKAGWDFMAQMGLRSFIRIVRRPWSRLEIVNPRGVLLDRNAVADSYIKNDLNRVRYFDPGRDNLEINEPRYQNLNFIPKFIQSMCGFKFVYLNPG